MSTSYWLDRSGQSSRDSYDVVIVGAEKRAALEQAQKLSPDEAPIAAFLPGTTVHWAES